MKEFFGWLYTIVVIVWLIGIFVFTPYFTAKYSIDLCKTHDPHVLDVYSAASMGLMMGFMWPARLVVGP